MHHFQDPSLLIKSRDNPTVQYDSKIVNETLTKSSLYVVVMIMTFLFNLKMIGSNDTVHVKIE